MSTPQTVPPDGWNVSPPGLSRIFYPIVRCKPDRVVRALIVCHHAVARFGHFTPGSHWTPCDLPAPCPLEHQGRNYRWYAWVGAQILDAPNPAHRGKLGLVELTTGVVADNPWLWSHAHDLRGVEVTLARNASDRGMVYLVRSHREAKDPRWKEFDQRSALARVWGYVPGMVCRLRQPAFDPPSGDLDGAWDDHAPPL